jgi:RNA polymerase sporulation-specific sigma factor
MPDEDLVALAREGDRPATDYILHKYRGLVEGKARAYFLPGAERADVVQEGMIGLYKAIRDYRSGHLAAFRSFAETCVTRQIITATKMASRKKHGLLNACTSIDWLCDENGGEPGNWLHSRISCTCPSAEEVVLGEVAAREIDRRMRVMLSRLETIAIRAYLSGRSYHEIAELENLSPKQVDNALQRAKRKLKCRMSPAALA